MNKVEATRGANPALSSINTTDSLLISRVIVRASSIRRGNCHDNAVAESFVNLLKRERIRRRVYRSRDEARQDVFDYIEMFYNPKRKHVRNGMLSPVEFEKQQKI